MVSGTKVHTYHMLFLTLTSKTRATCTRLHKWFNHCGCISQNAELFLLGKLWQAITRQYIQCATSHQLSVVSFQHVHFPLSYSATRCSLSTRGNWTILKSRNSFVTVFLTVCRNFHYLTLCPLGDQAQKPSLLFLLLQFKRLVCTSLLPPCCLKGFIRM